jgi:virginiamycin B lyase
VGSDGNLWFAVQTGLDDTQTGNIGRITPSGVVTEFTVPYSGSQPSSIAGGPDGNIWFTDQTYSSVDRFLMP